MLLTPAPTRRPVGAHTKSAGGLAKSALPRVDATSGEALQVYVSNSRGWGLPAGDPAQDTAFRDGCEQRAVPAYIHASLLVNVGSPTALTVERSAQTLAHGLRRGAAIGATAVVFHAGSSVDAAHDDKAMHQVRPGPARVDRSWTDRRGGVRGTSRAPRHGRRAGDRGNAE